MSIRKCSICKLKFNKEDLFYSGLKAYCSPECGAKLAIELLNKKKSEEEKEFKRETRRRREKLNNESKSFWKDKAQYKAFNPYIRLRDKNEPCISCGKFEHEIEPGPTGIWDCGHYRSVGACEELRFNPLNAHKQCYKCNRGGEMWGRKGGTVAQGYRENLIKKIGLDKVQWLDGPHEQTRYRLEDYKRIYKEFTDLIKTYMGEK